MAFVITKNRIRATGKDAQVLFDLMTKGMDDGICKDQQTAEPIEPSAVERQERGGSVQPDVQGDGSNGEERIRGSCGVHEGQASKEDVRGHDAGKTA